jgi:hypothetical protein
MGVAKSAFIVLPLDQISPNSPNGRMNHSKKKPRNAPFYGAFQDVPTLNLSLSQLLSDLFCFRRHGLMKEFHLGLKLLKLQMHWGFTVGLNILFGLII